MTSTPKPLVLLIALLMVSWVPNVMATDSDGDGVNDSADDFPNDPCADTDTDGDGMPDELPDDYQDSGLPPYDLVEDLDDDADGMPDVDEATNGTDSLNPDTDGDGICDGPSAPANGGCVPGVDAFPFDPSASKDTDGDGMPDTLTGESTSTPPLIEDEDDDNDGVNDLKETDCGTDPLCLLYTSPSPRD